MKSTGLPPRAWWAPRSEVEKSDESACDDISPVHAPAVTTVRKGQAPDLMARNEFSARFRAQFYDPAFRPHDAAIDAMEVIAWDAYLQGRKAPMTEKAGPEFGSRLRPLRRVARHSRQSTRRGREAS